VVAKRPLTRHAPADESAGARHPLPKGEGCRFCSQYIWTCPTIAAGITCYPRYFPTQNVEKMISSTSSA